jgi:hypothetical protein
MKNFNGFQTLAVVGLITSAVVQLVLLVVGKTVHTTWALYPCWIFVFLFGMFVKRFIKPEEDHHHH